MRLSWPVVFCSIFSTAFFAQDHLASNPITPATTPTVAQSTPSTSDIKARVFITDSQSWETRGSAGGSGGNWGAESHRWRSPSDSRNYQDIRRACPQVMVNNKQNIADYVVVLDHEGGKGYLQHRNKVAVFQALSGDSVMSHSTLSLGNSVKDACDGIDKDGHNMARRFALLPPNKRHRRVSRARLRR